MSISLILNTGVQYYQLPDELVIDLSGNVIKSIRFYEFQLNDKTYFEPVYFFPIREKYLRRSELIYAGYLDPTTNELIDERELNDNLGWLETENLLSVSRLETTIGDPVVRKVEGVVHREKLNGLQLLENKWLPLPFYENDITGTNKKPENWCRMKLVPILEKSTQQKRVFKVVLAFDTTEEMTFSGEGAFLGGDPFQHYSLCGVSRVDVNKLTDSQQENTINTVLLPLKVYEFCDLNERRWVNDYLQEVFRISDISALPVGKKMSHLAYYIYFVCYIHKLGILPDIKLYSDKEQPTIKTNVVLDIGNSRTFGLVAEDPLNMSFSKASVIELCDLETGDVYSEPFDMRLCFKEEKFGFEPIGSKQFKWPSIVRLGSEALRNIYKGEQDLQKVEQFDTSHSSPKRFLWDKKPYEGQWKFVSEIERVVGPSQTVFLQGLMQQFRSDGSFTKDPNEMGERSSYSRSSLMTFCFIEILLHIRMQINGVRFRQHNGKESSKREISRVILTCPTAMHREEQLTLRKCMEEATIVVNRFYNKTYNEPYDPSRDTEKVEIVPSVRDMSYTSENIDMKRHWNYDEATCCQMVYLYSELRRYLGKVDEFFGLYGKKRNGEKNASLTIASIDIGAGTSDLMICNYKNQGESVMPIPLFWESFHTAGDELVKNVISDVLLGIPKAEHLEASGVIVAKLQSLGQTDISNRMHSFFGDPSTMGAVEKRMRKEFNIQVLSPIANHLLALLQKEEDDEYLSFNDFFKETKPAESLMDFFANCFGFKFEGITIKYSKVFLNEIVSRVFEPLLRKWTAIFYAYRCDIVLLGGRPCSLKQIENSIKKLYPVTPNRLISMNDYRVGSWYPSSSSIGHFRDKKSLVAVGALIAYLGQEGKLPMFKISTDYLKTKVKPTTDYVGIMNPHTGTMDNFITPIQNYQMIELSAFPIYIGSKQLDVDGYPVGMMYLLDFDMDYIQKVAIENLERKVGRGQPLSKNDIQDEMDIIKDRAKRNVPLRFRFEREYQEDKEKIKIDGVENSNYDELSVNLFRLSLQSWAENELNWLDSGKFILHIGV
ncbi:virulence factor SrfB [Capnocytophaga canimorsus]|uniref:virulence factor SrfB n=1 Tax=Capnocytophaga canimorsus TaxID=28188 RepID=UPI00385AF661